MATDLTTPIGMDVPQRAAWAAARLTIDQGTIAILRRLARLMRDARPAMDVKIPLADREAGRVHPHVQHPDAEIEIKAKYSDLHDFTSQEVT